MVLEYKYSKIEVLWMLISLRIHLVVILRSASNISSTSNFYKKNYFHVIEKLEMFLRIIANPIQTLLLGAYFLAFAGCGLHQTATRTST